MFSLFLPGFPTVPHYFDHTPVVLGGNHSVPPIFFRLKLLRGSGGDYPPRRRFGGRASKVLLLTLILILTFLPPKGGLGAQPQGFDFVFLPEEHHVHDALQARTKTLGASPPNPHRQ